MLRVNYCHQSALNVEEVSHRVANPYTPLESFVRDFPYALTDLSSLVGMAVGGLAFRAARFSYLGWASRWAGGMLGRGLMGRVFSAAAGTMAEGPLYYGASRLVDPMQSTQGPRSHIDPWRELAATEVTLSSLRTFAWAGEGMLALALRGTLGGRFQPLASHLILGAF